MSQVVPLEHESDHILIVEGYSDLHFYAEFLRQQLHRDDVFIKEFKGKSNILDLQTLELYLTPKRLIEKKSIGILIDADENPVGTAQALRDHLCAITGRAIRQGEWNDGSPRLGHLVVPGEGIPGELETLVWQSIPAKGRFSEMKQTVEAFHLKMEKLGWKAKSIHKGYLGSFSQSPTTKILESVQQPGSVFST